MRSLSHVELNANIFWHISVHISVVNILRISLALLSGRLVFNLICFRQWPVVRCETIHKLDPSTTWNARVRTTHCGYSNADQIPIKMEEFQTIVLHL